MDEVHDGGDGLGPLAIEELLVVEVGEEVVEELGDGEGGGGLGVGELVVDVDVLEPLEVEELELVGVDGAVDGPDEDSRDEAGGGYWRMLAVSGWRESSRAMAMNIW